MASNGIAKLMAAKRAGLNKPSAPIAEKKPANLRFYQQALTNDIAKLKAIPVLEQKQALKVDLLKTYDGFITDYIASAENYPNAVAVQVMVWLFDTSSIEKALTLAFVLVKQQQQMPDGFGRDMPTFVCDAVYDWANDFLKARKSVSPYLDWLVEKLPFWTVDYLLHPAVVSKNYAMLAKHKEIEGDKLQDPAQRDSCYQQAVELCILAETVNPDGHGVKSLKKRNQSKQGKSS